MNIEINKRSTKKEMNYDQIVCQFFEVVYFYFVKKKIVKK
jgi:hypothetical protein